ncbi:MAG: outer membrane protein assembly factor BamB [Gallionellaceae bacterium]|nr:outer membrane protein assembly factor BamB [Gallionellaceae bacterium]
MTESRTRGTPVLCCRPVAVALFSVALLTGCSWVSSVKSSWMGRDKNDPAMLTEFKESAMLEVRWHHDIGGAGNNALYPAVMRDAVYAANAKGEVFRLERNTGKEMWRVDSGFAISGGVGAGDGLVLVGGMKGELAALDEKGKPRWKVQMTSEVLSAPQVADGVVVVRTGDGRIAGLSVADGKRQWLYERATPALIVRSHAGVSIEHGIVYAGFAGGKLAAIGLINGAIVWESAVSQPRGNTELERISDITSLPVADKEQVCAVAFQGRIACFDIAHGSLLWSRDMSSDNGMVLLKKSLYVTDVNGVVSAMDKSSGSSLWKNDQLTLRRVSTPNALGNYVAVGDYEGYLHVLSRDDGRLVARLKTDGSGILAAPVELDGGLLVQTRDGGLYSVGIKD